jgi:hypothetical protein
MQSYRAETAASALRPWCRRVRHISRPPRRAGFRLFDGEGLDLLLAQPGAWRTARLSRYAAAAPPSRVAPPSGIRA